MANNINPDNHQKLSKKSKAFLQNLLDQQTSEIRDLSNNIDPSSPEFLVIRDRVFGENRQNLSNENKLNVAGSENSRYLRIFDPHSLIELSKRSSVGREERKFYESLQSVSAEKPLREADLSVIERIEALFELYPNANELLKYVRDFLNLRRVAKHNKSIYLPPICISGQAGIGKTAVIKAICRALDVEYAFYDFSAASSSWGLTGQDSAWTSSHPGLVLKTLIHGECANPVVHIDEIDKAQVNHNLDPFLCLHTLLERPQMYRYIDSYAQNLPLSAQYVMFMSTANNVDAIPATIRSRLRIIEMQAPSGMDMRKISQNMYRNLLQSEDVEDVFHENLSEDVINWLSTKTPREAGLVLARGLASAATRNTESDRYNIKLEDCINTSVEQDQYCKKMGFIW